MCVAYPMQIVSVSDDTHCIVSDSGVERKINTRLLPGCAVGDFVLVHAGYAIERVRPDDAENDLEIFREMEDMLKK